MVGYEQYFYAAGIVVLSFVSTLLVVSLVKSKNKNKELVERLSNREEIANESYVKFLNESRDWAYAYIEDVQNRLTEFANKVEPQLNYFNTYGTTVQGPHQILVKEITEAYEELKSVLPEENKEK